MNGLMKILIPVAMLLTLSGCGEGKADAGKRDPLISGQINGMPANETLAAVEAQLDSMRAGLSKENPVTTLSRAGYLYTRYGDYVRGMEYLNEATDSMKTQPKDSVDPGSAIRLFANRSNLYTRLGLYDEARRLNSEALRISIENNGMNFDDLWRFRAETFKDPYQKDSVMGCYDQALRGLDRYPAKVDKRLLRAGIQFDRAMTFIERPEQFPDSLDRAVQILECNLQAVDYPYSALERFYLGRAFVMKGNAAEGIALMEPYVAEMREKGPGEDLDWAVQMMAEGYAQAGMGDRLVRIFPEYRAVMDSAVNSAKLDAVVAADFKYRTAEKEARAEELENVNRLSRRLIVWQSVVAALLIIIAGFAVVALMKRNRRLVSKRRDDMKIISNLLDHQQKLNSTIESLNTSIGGLNSKIEDLNGEIESREHSEVVEKVMTELNPSVLSVESEREFRRSFARLYPHFLRDLREEFPSLTPNDELVCMLIYLKLSSEEIALSLGINRLSVNTARHRLRKKFNLDKQTDLSAFILSRTP